MRPMRFPRRAYARRAEKLAGDLWNWNAIARTRALGPEANIFDIRTRDNEETRGYAFEHAAMLAEQLTDFILSIR